MVKQEQHKRPSYGSLIEAYIYMKGEQDVISMYEGRFQEAMTRLKTLLKQGKMMTRL